MHIGKRIKQIREQKDMQQKDIANLTGLSQAYLSKLEKQKSCQTDTLELICIALNITPSYFFSEDDFYDNSDSLKKNDVLADLVKEIGMDYLVLTNELKKDNLSPEEIRNTINQLKSLGLLKSQ